MSRGAAGLPSHAPVLLHEVLRALNPRAGAIYVDSTFGAGGYSRALLEAAECTVWGIDRDPQAVAAGRALARAYAGRLEVLHGRFGDMAALLGAHGVTSVDGVALDLGVSSMQLDTPDRGFSFRADGPLDMRMDASAGPTAAEVVNELEESRLADLIYVFGEERHARRIARAIARARRAGPIRSTLQLAEIVRGVAPAGRRRKAAAAPAIDPATRTFQALRIYVNDELGELERGLCAAETVLAPGGRLAVVSFHSLEDRRVKEFLRDRAGLAPRGSRHRPEAAAGGRAPSFRLLGRRAIKPAAGEIAANPRSRSARLRAAERTAAPPWPAEPAQGPLAAEVR